MKQWKGMIGDQFFYVESDLENEAEILIVKELREKFNTMTDEQLVDAFGIIVWEE